MHSVFSTFLDDQLTSRAKPRFKAKTLQKSTKLKSSPYKTTYISRSTHRNRSESIISNILITVPTTTRNFPIRKPPSKSLSSHATNSRSSKPEKISLFHITHIEKLQQLIPYSRQKSQIPEFFSIFSQSTTRSSYKKYKKNLS